MELILKRCDLRTLKSELPNEFIRYLEQEFEELYEYYCREEDLEGFTLGQGQAICIVQNDEELNSLLSEKFEIEYVENMTLGDFKFYRLGFRNVEEIQLFYIMESNHSDSMIDKLGELCE